MRTPLNALGQTVVLVVLLSACAETSARGDLSQARDSAGVRIIESSAPAWREEQAWQVDPQPALEIGVESGDERYEFYRVLDGVRLADGRIVISNAGTQQLRIYDAQGVHLTSIGGKGAGPGEFAEFSAMRICVAIADTLIVDDSGNQRQNVFADTVFARTFRIEPIEGSGRPFHSACFADGSLLTRGAVGGGAIRGDPGSIIRTTWEVHRHAADGSPVRMLTRADDRPRFVSQVGDITHFPFVPFHAEPVFAAAGEYAFFGNGSQPEIQRVDTAGSRQRIIRWVPQQPTRTADVYERYQAESLATMSERQRPLYAHFYRQTLPIPDQVPFFQAIEIDTDGNLWLERFRLPWDSVPAWEVFDQEGTWLGAVETPRRLRVLQIGRDYVLGRHIDELSVERVRLHRLIKQ